jgi:hypothetical protein
MKTKLAGLMVAMILTTFSLSAQKRITVEVPTDDISKNLDLKAVATTFGESKDLEEFEQKLNDNNSKISNLDLNNDGEADYLRVIEKTENSKHIIVIQAVLSKDKYQDVATINVEKDSVNQAKVEIAGNPELYGENYIIEPVYLYTPSLFSLFWAPNYFCWHSPYYWGYYPTYFHHRRIMDPYRYRSHIYNHFGRAVHYQPINVKHEFRSSAIRSGGPRYIHSNNRSFNVQRMSGVHSGGGGRNSGGGRGHR